MHDAIVGALRAGGGTFSAWCEENGVTQTNMRAATFGMARGPSGSAKLTKLITDANPDVVMAGYMARLKAHAVEMKVVS